jgi:hypothetical protein
MTHLERLKLVLEEWEIKKVRIEVDLSAATKLSLKGEATPMKEIAAKKERCDFFIEVVNDEIKIEEDKMRPAVPISNKN